jgi:ferric-dicitrate binding protein FerR (iron transport regulator)
VTAKRGDTPGNETEEERVLRTGLQVNPLSAEAMSRIRTATEAEWRANVEWRAKVELPSRRWLPYAAAASLFALAVLVGLLFMGPLGRPDHGELAAHLVRFEAPGVVEVHVLRADSSLTEGAVLRSGRTYQASGQALVDLEGGGNLRVASGSQFEILARNDVRLESGELYVDIPPGTSANSAFIVRTAAGEFRHAGTQFALAVIQGETRLRVREGSVRWLAADGESTVPAGTEVMFTDGAKAVERPIGTSGNEWEWTAKTTPDFAIDNRPLGEFLAWVARESGRKLVLADDQAREQVTSIRMHGSVHGLTPMQALSAVMATTELRYDLPDGQIRVSFASEPAPRK